MFLRDGKINSVSIIKTNVAAVKKKIKMGKKYQKKKYFGTGVYKARFFRRAKSSSCFVISGVRFL